MIEFVANGNIMNSEDDAIVNPVNCVGVMGAGLALQFKNQYPGNFAMYQQVCKNDFLVPGKMFIYERDGYDRPYYIINFPTKQHWKDKSSMGMLEIGLLNLVIAIESRWIESISVPALGCGLGGLDYKDVKPVLCKHLSFVLDKCKVTIYEPHTKSRNVQKP